jgi:hypothetical protein
VRIKDHFPLPNMEMILHQVAGSQMMSLLDGFSSYNHIKVNRLIGIKPLSLQVGEHLLMNACLLDYLMKVSLSKDLCR